MKRSKKLRVFEAFAGIGAQASALKRLNLNPKVVTHIRILNYETANKVDEELGLTGTETKT